MEEEYVRRHEWERSKGNIHKRINQIDKKHDDKHHALELTLTELSHISKQMVDGNKGIKDELVKLNGNMTLQRDEIYYVKQKTKENTDRIEKNEEDLKEDREELEKYKQEAKEKKKDNVDMIKWAINILFGSGILIYLINYIFGG